MFIPIWKMCECAKTLIKSSERPSCPTADFTLPPVGHCVTLQF